MAAPLLDVARSLTPLIEEEAAEAERLGRLTDRVVTALTDAGLFGLMVPAELGGDAGLVGAAALARGL